MKAINPALIWTGTIALLALCLAVDLWMHRRARTMATGGAVRSVAAWVGVAIICAGAAWLLLGTGAALQFTAAYAIEWLLSIDNVLVFVMLIASLAVPRPLRYRVLFFGSLGAIVLRSTFILAGSALLARFDWLMYVFGLLLLIAAARFALNGGEDDQPPADSRLGRLLLRWLPVSRSYDGGRLFSVSTGRRVATPLLVAVLLVVVTDVVFAADSIPAVLAMTRDPLLAFSSNVLAVAGLRSLYFLLEAAMVRFRYLQPALVILLVFVSTKILAAPLFEVPALVTLAVIATVLGTAVLASWALPPAPVPADRP